MTLLIKKLRYYICFFCSIFKLQRPCSTFFVTLLMSEANKEFCMEMKSCNIFKTSNAMALTETILESTCKNLQSL